MLDADPEGDDIEAPEEEWRPEREPTDAEVLAARRGRPRPQARPGRRPRTRTVRDLGRATRNPVVVAAANQVRDGLRGPLGAVLNIGRERVARGRVGRAAAERRAPHAVQRDDHPPPTLRLPLHAAQRGQGHEERARRHGQRRRHGRVRRRAAHVAREARRPARRSPLVAMVPVSIRTGEETEKWTNRVSGIFASLPTDEPDPVQRVAKVHEAMAGAKGLFDAVPADALTDFAQFPPPAVFARAMRTATRLSARFRCR